MGLSVEVVAAAFGNNPCWRWALQSSALGSPPKDCNLGPGVESSGKGTNTSDRPCCNQPTHSARRKQTPPSPSLATPAAASTIQSCRHSCRLCDGASVGFTAPKGPTPSAALRLVLGLLPPTPPPAPAWVAARRWLSLQVLARGGPSKMSVDGPGLAGAHFLQPCAALRWAHDGVARRARQECTCDQKLTNARAGNNASDLAAG